jgi:hypothetical protein
VVEEVEQELQVEQDQYFRGIRRIRNSKFQLQIHQYLIQEFMVGVVEQ